MIRIRSIAAASAALLFALSGVGARAAFEEPAGWTRPNNDTEATAALTTYQEWTPSSSLATPYFDIAAGTNPPRNDLIGGVSANPNGTPDVYDAAGVAGIASSGNLYSPTQVIDPVVTIPGYNLGGAYVTSFVVQVWTSGQDLAPGLTVNGVDATTLDGFDYERLSETLFSFDPDGPGPAPVVDVATIEHRMLFTIVGSDPLYTLDFDWQGLVSTSMGHLRVDTLTAAVPTPGAAMAGAVGLIALAMRRKRTTGRRGV